MKSADGRFEYLDKDHRPLPDDASLSDVGRFAYHCRLHLSNMCSVNIANAGYKIPKRSWVLTGTKDAPTLEPSINCENCWHGYIQCGVFFKTDRTKEQNQ